MHTSNRSVEHTWNKQGEIIDQCDCRITLLSVEKKKEKKRKKKGGREFAGRSRFSRETIFGRECIQFLGLQVFSIPGQKKWQGWKQREGQRGGEEQFVNTRKVGRTNIGETISLRFFDIFSTVRFSPNVLFPSPFLFSLSYALFCFFFFFSTLSVTI